MKFWNFTEGEQVELRIEGEIVDNDNMWLYEWFDIKATSPNTFKEALSTYAGKDITVWIDSWGGDTTAAAGIYNALKEHKGKKTVKIDSKAASAASVIAMAGDTIEISPLALMMIHNPWLMGSGESKDMRHLADILDEVKESIMNAYQTKTGKSRNKISEMMDAETWMSAKTAVKEGFADKIMYVEEKEDEKPKDFFISRFAIQNSAAESMKRILEQYKKLEPSQEGFLESKDTRQVPVSLYKNKNKIHERRLSL